MKTLLALSFITYSRVVSGGACSEPSTPHVRGGNGSESGRGGGGGNPGEQLPNRDASTPTASPSDFDNIRDKLGCAKTYDEYVDQLDPAQASELFSFRGGDERNEEHERLFLYQTLRQATVGSYSVFSKNCKPDTWHFDAGEKRAASSTPDSEELAGIDEEYKKMLKVLDPTLAEDKVFLENYNNSIAFPTAPPRSHPANVDKLYYCHRMLKSGVTDATGSNLISYGSIRNSPVGALLQHCGSETEHADDQKIAEVICPKDRLNMLRRIDKTVFDAHVEGIRTVFNRRMELINEEQAPSMEINGSFSVPTEAFISKRKTCLMTQTFNDAKMTAISIFKTSACKCSAIDESVFTPIAARQLDMARFKCKWDLQSYLLSSENAQSCLAAQNSIEVYKELSAAAAFYAPASGQ